MFKITVTNIEWDVDDDADLPSQVTLSLEDISDNYTLDETIPELLSDKYGYCVLGFNYDL
jgi:hypothetical protein